MWVVKVGGSLADSATLLHWLEQLAQTDAIIVPGGGPFAEEVRRMQAVWRFGDSTAHDMAILAMRQYGLMLAGLGGVGTFTSVAEFLADRQRGQARVWLPLPENLNAVGIPGSWEITSDSLAAWLAGELKAEHLLLVKSVALGENRSACERLMADGVIDQAFKEFSRNVPFRSWICGREGHPELAYALQHPAQHFIPISHGCPDV